MEVNIVTETALSLRSLLQGNIKIVLDGVEKGIPVRLGVNMEKGINIKDLALPCFIAAPLTAEKNRSRDFNLKKVYGDRDTEGNVKEYDAPVPIDLSGELEALTIDVSTDDRLLVEMIRIARETKEIPVYYDRTEGAEKFDNFPIFWGDPVNYPSGDVYRRGYPFKVWAWVGTIRYVLRKVVLSYDVGGFLMPGTEQYRQCEGRSMLVV